MSHYLWVHQSDGTRLFNVGIEPDGTLINPNGYPEDIVRAAVLATDERRHQRRSAGSKKAAQTRRERTARLVYSVARHIVKGGRYGPRHRCVICRKHLTDQQSITRGIGSDCWQDVLARISELRAS